LWPRLLVDRDSGGSFGSAQATRVAVTALLESEAPAAAGAPRGPIRWTEITRAGRPGASGSVDVAPSGSVAIALPATASAVRVETAASPGLIARVERAMLRSFQRPPDPTASPLHLVVEAPRSPAAGGTALLQISLRHDLGRAARVMARIPLPPGATLAEPVEQIRQVQGALYLRATLDSDPLPRVFAIPLRFALPGTVTWPEASARIDDDELPPARAAARPLVVRPRG
jgi:hypothetical protein